MSNLYIKRIEDQLRELNKSIKIMNRNFLLHNTVFITSETRNFLEGKSNPLYSQSEDFRKAFDQCGEALKSTNIVLENLNKEIFNEEEEENNG